MTFFHCKAMDRGKLEALHHHALRGNYSDVQSLLNEGVDPNGKDSYGQTPLMKAALGSHTEVVELLIKSGADIHCCSYQGWTALFFASYKGSVKMVQYLVSKGVVINMKNSFGRTPLLLAAQGSHAEVIKVLINSGADIHCCDEKGWTVLHYAADGWVDIVQCLVNKEVAMNKKNYYGETPLFLAAQGLHREVTEVLINSGADIHSCNNYGWTVLHHASCQGWMDIVQCLVNKGVAINVKNKYGKTPLHFTVEKGRIEISDYLLRAGADCNLEDDEGESPFSFLIRQEKHVETIKLCIKKGAYVKLNDYNNLLEDPLLKEAILQDVQLCSQAMINKFNNKDLPLLYRRLAPAQKLPHFDQMEIGNGSGMAQEVERAVTYDIQAKGFCNLLEMVPLVLGMLCVKASLENSRPAFNQASTSASENSLERLGENNKQKHPWVILRKIRNLRHWCLFKNVLK